MKQDKCENWVYPNWAYGKLPKYKCNKPITNYDIGGRGLCKKHFNKWFKKNYKMSYDEFMNETIKN